MAPLANKNAATHGHSGSGAAEATGAYASWRAMRRRCLMPNTNRYAMYGGRGITICPAWDDFLTFLADMGERPPGLTLDRIDVDGNYEPGNCRWATAKEQRGNRR